MSAASGAKVALPKFDKNDDWELHFKKLDWYFASNNIEPSKKVQILLTSITPAVYKILTEHCRPELPKNKNYDTLHDLMRDSFGQMKKKPIYRERMTFYSAVQAENESIRHWYSRIKGLSASCEFGARVNSVLKDKFVTGITNQRVLNRLYEVSPAVSLNDVLKIAVNEETPNKKGIWRKLIERDSEKNNTVIDIRMVDSFCERKVN